MKSICVNTAEEFERNKSLISRKASEHMLHHPYDADFSKIEHAQMFEKEEEEYTE